MIARVGILFSPLSQIISIIIQLVTILALMLSDCTLAIYVVVVNQLFEQHICTWTLSALPNVFVIFWEFRRTTSIIIRSLSILTSMLSNCSLPTGFEVMRLRLEHSRYILSR